MNNQHSSPYPPLLPLPSTPPTLLYRTNRELRIVSVPFPDTQLQIQIQHNLQHLHSDIISIIMNLKNLFLFLSTFFHNLIFFLIPRSSPFTMKISHKQIQLCWFILSFQNTGTYLDITNLPIGSEESVIMTSNSPWCFFMYSNPSPICSDNFELSKPMAIFGRYFLETSITFC